MRKFTMSLILALSALSSNANADFLGLYVGGGVWDHDPVGYFGTTGATDDAIDMETNLNYSGEKDSYVYAAFEHFVPFVPNVRIERASMNHTGASAATFNFNGVAVPAGNSSIALDTTDTIIYWRLLDNWVNFDFGFNARKLTGDFTLGAETVSVSETVPMLYLAAQFDLPFSGFSVGMDINNISYSDVSYQDVRIRALYEMGVFGVELGMKTTTLELKGLDSVDADLEFSGMMVGAFLHF